MNRRKFILRSAAAAGGGLALGFNLPFGLSSAAAQAAAAAGAEINAWVFVKPNDTCVIRIARSEMGQGTLTGLAQLVVEELECDWKKVATEQFTAGQNLARKRVWGEMSTGGSRGIRISQDYVRRGGAAARMMLLQAAADQWNVPVGEVTVANGVITHAASQRSTTYGKVAGAAARLTPPDPKSIQLRDPKEWKIAGRPMKRLDTADKLNGTKIYSIDLKLPGMLHAAVKACPVFGGKLVSYDESKLSGRPGVHRVVKVNDSTVGVVANTWWRAKTALDALPIVWDEGAGATQSSATIAARLKEGLTASGEPLAGWQEGDALKAIEGAAKKVEAVYSTPFLAHATMEPMNATAKVTPDRVEVWVPTQNAEASLAAATEEAGLPLDRGEVYKLDLAGGFARRGVNTNQNGVYLECFMDEVARAAGQDPLEFRRALMASHPMHLAVLNAAADKAGWGKPLPAGVHRGIAQFMGYGNYSAAVAELSVSDKGQVSVHRMVLALNCGHAVNPDQIAAQVEGSVAYGLTATLYGECSVENGRMVESNFHNYPIMRLAEMPKVETVIVPSYDFWGGVGEPTISVVAPSVMNAIYAATGKPVRSLPLKKLTLA